MSGDELDVPEAASEATAPRWIWLIPVLAAAASAWLIYEYLGQRGIPIEITFAQGYGLKPGDMVKYRGIDVGVVDELVLSREPAHVTARVRLHPEARGLAREGSLFWIVRPEVGWTEAKGLETVIGAKHMIVLPGQGPPRTRFEGREKNPAEAMDVPGGLTLVLDSPSAGGLRPGAYLAYRQVAVGEIIDVSLAEDRQGVEVRVAIPPAYRDLISQHSVFWKTSGARLQAGLFRGVRLELDSLHSLLIGGISMHPNPSGREGSPVVDGHRFPLRDEPEEDWLTGEE